MSLNQQFGFSEKNCCNFSAGQLQENGCCVALFEFYFDVYQPFLTIQGRTRVIRPTIHPDGSTQTLIEEINSGATGLVPRLLL